MSPTPPSAPDQADPALEGLFPDAEAEPEHEGPLGLDILTKAERRLVEESVEQLPSKLSPSRASDFLSCPRRFYYKSILRLPDEPGPEAVKGTLTHRAIELTYEMPDPAARTLAAALANVIVAYDELVDRSPGWAELVPVGSPTAIDAVAFAEQMVRNYYEMEDPTAFTPTANEQYLSVDLPAGLVLHGYIDRLDDVISAGKTFTYVSDYKTGRAPNPQWAHKSFYAMRLYALMLAEATGRTPYQLRLLYLQAASRDGVLTEAVHPAMIAATRRHIIEVWRRIKRAYETRDWQPKPGPLCNYCPFTDICPATADHVSGFVAIEQLADEVHGWAEPSRRGIRR